MKIISKFIKIACGFIVALAIIIIIIILIKVPKDNTPLISFENYVTNNSYSKRMDEMLSYINVPFSKIVDKFGDNYFITNETDSLAMKFCTYSNRVEYYDNETELKFEFSIDDINNDNYIKNGVIDYVVLDKLGEEIIKGIHIGDNIEQITKKNKCTLDGFTSNTFIQSVYYDDNIVFSYEFYNGILMDVYLSKSDRIAYGNSDCQQIENSYKQLCRMCAFYSTNGDERYNIDKFEYNGISYLSRIDCLCYNWKNKDFEYEGDVVNIAIEPSGEKRAYIEFGTNGFSPRLMWANDHYAFPYIDYIGFWSSLVDTRYYLDIKEFDYIGNYTADFYLWNGNGYAKFCDLQGKFDVVDSDEMGAEINASYHSYITGKYDDGYDFSLMIFIMEGTHSIRIYEGKTNMKIINGDVIFTEQQDRKEDQTINSINSLNTILNYSTYITPILPEESDKLIDENDGVTNKQYIREFGGKIIGTVEILENGDKVVRDFSGMIMGRYIKERDVTVDFEGKIVFEGDNVSGLLNMKYNA